MMKTQSISLVVVLVYASLGLSGCVNPNKRETMVQSPDTTNKRVHTHEELQKTGQSETGAALEKVDPAVQVSGPH